MPTTKSRVPKKQAYRTTVSPDEGQHGRGPMTSERTVIFDADAGKGYPMGGLWTPTHMIHAEPRVEECMTSLHLWYTVTSVFATGDEARAHATMINRALAAVPA